MTQLGGIGAFPFSSLERLTRADALAAARLGRIARDLVDVGEIEAALGELTGERVLVTAGRARRREAPRGTDGAIGVAIASAAEAAPSKHVLVEVDGALGATLVARALRQKAPRVVDGSRAPTPALAGALAAVLIAALRRAHVGVALRVIAAGPAADLTRDMLVAERDVMTAALTIVVGSDAFEARVSVPDGLAPRAPLASARRLSRVALAAMGDARLALPLVIATTLCARADLDDLEPGDVIVPAKLGLEAGQDRSLVGPVAMVAPTSERGLSADLASGGRLVLRGKLENHPWCQERSMSSDRASLSETTPFEVSEALEQAPVVVRVELGSVEMKAREWAELAPGDVIALGRRIGDPAVLRVGGVELARGELVQVDGEYGVRIVARTGAGAARGGEAGGRR